MTDVLVDVGRSHVRAVAGDNTHTLDRGGAVADGTLVDVVRAAVSALPPREGAPDVTGSAEPCEAWRLAVAAPGVATDPAAASVAADSLLGAFGRPPASVVLVSDSVAWQVGAFAGGDGAVVALGTGAVVVARRGGEVTRLDGLGLLLGDVGGGAWTGRAALQRAAVTRGPLHDAAVTRYGPPAQWPALSSRPDLPSLLAAFTVDVARLATAGDPEAEAVLTAAADGVAATLAGLPADLPLALTGGFAPVLADRLAGALPDRTFVEPAGDAIDGLRLVLADAGPFENALIRRDLAESSVTARRTRDHDTDGLPTEEVAADTADLDLRPTVDVVARLIEGQAAALAAAQGAVATLARAADLVADALAGTGRLVYVGAGTAGRIAVQDSAELLPTFGLDPARAVVLLAGGAAATTRAVENAEDDLAAAVEAVDAGGIGPHDVVVGVSASGRTPFVVAALQRSGERGAALVGVSSVADSPLSRLADVAVDLPTGPEVIAGSTRLAAGTAQKIALNTISTAAMVRVGATYGPWMVDLLATNDKLRRRSVRIVRDVAGVDEQAATDTLAAAEGSVAVALVMALARLDAETARGRLAAARSVRAAVTR